MRGGMPPADAIMTQYSSFTLRLRNAAATERSRTPTECDARSVMRGGMPRPPTRSEPCSQHASSSCSTHPHHSPARQRTTTKAARSVVEYHLLPLQYSERYAARTNTPYHGRMHTAASACPKHAHDQRDAARPPPSPPLLTQPACGCSLCPHHDEQPAPTRARPPPAPSPCATRASPPQPRSRAGSPQTGHPCRRRHLQHPTQPAQQRPCHYHRLQPPHAARPPPALSPPRAAAAAATAAAHAAARVSAPRRAGTWGRITTRRGTARASQARRVAQRPGVHVTLPR